MHFEDGIVYAEPGVDTAALEAAGRAISRFRERNLFFGGVQAAQRDPAAASGAAAIPRRGGRRDRGAINRVSEIGVHARPAGSSLVLVRSPAAGWSPEPDLFVLTRTGQGKTLTQLVNDAGTISCNGGKTKMLADPLLFQARDLATTSTTTRRPSSRSPPTPDSVYFYTVRLHDGTI